MSFAIEELAQPVLAMPPPPPPPPPPETLVAPPSSAGSDTRGTELTPLVAGLSYEKERHWPTAHVPAHGGGAQFIRVGAGVGPEACSL